MGNLISPKDLLTLPLGGHTLGVAEEMGDVERLSIEQRRRQAPPSTQSAALSSADYGYSA